MKVLVIHTEYQFRGGEDSVVQNEIELLTFDSHEVELLRFSNTGNTLLKLLQLPFNFAAYRAAKNKIKDFKPDVIHIHNMHFAATPAVIYAAKKNRVPVVITLHNYRLLCPSATLFYNNAIYTGSLNKDFSWDPIFKGVYHNSKVLTFWVSLSMFIHQRIGTWKIPAKYIALGEFTRELFSKSKLSYIVPAVDIKPNFCYENRTDISGPGNFYLYIGRLSEEKGLNVLIDSFMTNGLPLKIAGTGPLEKNLKDCAVNAPNIDFLGSIDRDQIDDLLNRAKALIFPSLWYETFGMVIIEAFAAGVPVIATKLGQMAITINDGVNGLHFKPGSATDLSETVLYFENLNDEAKALYRRGALKTYDDLYTPDKNLKALLRLYNAAIAAKN